MTKVSIIVPFYGVEKYIDKCLNSLVNQTLKDIEIIMVNDETPDNSQDIVDKYLKQYKNVKCIKQKNGGLGNARNTGLKKATGEYILYVDSDDFIDIHMCEEMYNSAIKNKSDIVICGNNEVNEDYEVTKVSSCYSYEDHKNIKLNLLLGKVCVWNKLFKKSYLDKHNISFRSKIWYEDIDYTTILCYQTKKISFVDKPFYNYLIREGSIMNNKKLEKNMDLIQAFDRINTYYKDNKDMKSIIEFLCIYNMYICGNTRLIVSSNKLRDARKYIKQYNEYLYENYPNFKNNEYIKYLERNKNIVFKLMNLKFYSLIKLIFKVRG